MMSTSPVAEPEPSEEPPAPPPPTKAPPLPPKRFSAASRHSLAPDIDVPDRATSRLSIQDITPGHSGQTEPPARPRRPRTVHSVDDANRPSADVGSTPPVVPPRPLRTKPRPVISRPEVPVMNATLAPENEVDSGPDDHWEDLGNAMVPTGADDGNTMGLTATPKMKTYEARLATFAAWPADHPQDPKSLAKYGMFYKGPGDRTQCYSCGVVIWGWEPYKGLPKAALIAHKRFYRDCDFLKGRSWVDTASKLNLTGSMMDWDKADAPYMMLESARYDSFKNLHPPIPERAKQLSEAGFFLSSANCTSCFYCAFALPLDNLGDPWLIHAQSQPRCTYLSRKKGLLYIKKAQKRLHEEAYAAEHPTDPNSNFEVHNPVETNHLGILQDKIAHTPAAVKNYVVRKVLPRLSWNKPNVIETDHQTTQVEPAPVGSVVTSPPVTRLVTFSPRPVPSPLTTTTPRARQSFWTDLPPPSPIRSEVQTSKLQAVNAVVKMGFSVQQVDTALKEFDRRDPQPEFCVESLVQLICDLEEDNRALQTAQSLVEPPPATGDLVIVTNVQLSGGNNGSDRKVSQTTVINTSVERTSHPLSPKRNPDRLCVICLEEQAIFAFVPCGHVSTCRSCSGGVTQCPMCREPIKDRIRVYF